MKRDPRAILEDIRVAAARIAGYTAGIDSRAYAADWRHQSVVERQFTIIGEALNHLRRSDPAAAERITARRDIVDFRNLLIHGYFSADHAQVWDAAAKDLPALRREVDELLAGLDRTAGDGPPDDPDPPAAKPSGGGPSFDF